MGLKRVNKVSYSAGLLDVFVATQLLPAPEIFLVTDGVFTFYTNQAHHISQSYFTEKPFWVKLALYSFLNLPNKLPYLVDGIQYTHTGDNFILQYNYNFMSTDVRLHLYTTISSSSFFCESLSTVYPSSVWLERELSDFSGLIFQGLTDSRRLLLDYFQHKQTYKTHTDNDRTYNNTSYEVLFNF